MKFLRYGPKGHEKPGMLHKDGSVRDLSHHVTDFVGATVSIETLAALAALDADGLPIVAEPGRIGSCLADVPNFYCIGLNYAKHAAEAGMAIPTEPVVFSKATSALSGPFDDVMIPRGSVKTDWEVELGIVIGRGGSNISKADALSHVAGYCLINDVSERAWQLERGTQWIKGKSAPTFGPTGPWLVTADEIADPQDLRLQLSVNGQTLQDSNTSDMIFNVVEIVSYLSEILELRCGDVIATGTPAGVGMGLKPPRFLAVGDVMELEITGLGRQRQVAVAAK